MVSDGKHRSSIRLQGYDYSAAGAYYVTICTHDRSCLFGDVVGGVMIMNECGRIVEQELIRTPTIRREIRLDTWVVMPNHVHVIIVIDDVGSQDVAVQPVGATGRSPLPAPRGPSPRSLGSFIAGFKSSVTMRINQHQNTPGHPVWQRNYYEHVVRNGRSYDTIKRYVLENPLHWGQDAENPYRTRG
ncbi:hypothetical protein EG831_05025 [bacterium]|nr:hypothetical protein [bacterium]